MTPPPIASPHEEEKPRSFSPPFLGLRVFIGLNVLVLFRAPLGMLRHPQSWGTVTAFGIFLLLWLLLLWRLWHYSGVARAIFWWISLLFLVGTLLDIVSGVSNFQDMPLGLKLVNYAAEALNAFGIVWLQLPGVKAHFQKSS